MKRRELHFVILLFLSLTALLFYGALFVWYHNTQQKQEAPPSEKTSSERLIRVLLTTSDFQSRFHKELIVTSDQAYAISYGKIREVKQAGETVTLSAGEITEQEYHIAPLEGGTLQVLSIRRAYGNPSYPGTLEVVSTLGGLVLVNQLPLESYLRYVVPSEMPASFGLEALKAQAICARTFAMKHIQEPSFPVYQAHLDDSIRFQVYQNASSHPLTDRAIQETAHQVLCFQEKLANTYYYSTSWGYTTDGTIWSDTSLPYFQSRFVGKEQGASSLDLTKETVFRQVMDQGAPRYREAYEASEKWFRWETTISGERVKTNLHNLGYAQVDAVQEVRVEARGAGGRVSKLRIITEKAPIVLTKESEIRGALCPTQEDLILQDSSVLEGYEKLPSPYFYMDTKKKEGTTQLEITIHGGGSGHGLGMSQCGANQLAKEGKSAVEILTYFYPGTSCETCEEMESGVY